MELKSKMGKVEILALPVIQPAPRSSELPEPLGSFKGKSLSPNVTYYYCSCHHFLVRKWIFINFVLFLMTILTSSRKTVNNCHLSIFS